MKLTQKKFQEISKCDGVVLPYFENEKHKYEELEVLKDFKIPLKQLKEKELFEGKKGQLYNFSIIVNNNLVQVALLGLGSKKDFTVDILRKSVSKGFRAIKAAKASVVGVVLDDVTKGKLSSYEIGRCAAEAVIMGSYSFDEFKTAEKKEFFKETYLVFDKKDKEFEKGMLEGKSLGEADIFARELVNSPSNIMTPSALAEKVVVDGDEKGYEVRVHNFDKIKKLGMHAYIAVAKASTLEPKLIVMKYMNNPGGEILGLVGKGLTYDSGGLSIKPTNGMVTMKSDMGGAAAVIGAMSAIAENKLKVNVIAVVAACENAIAGNAYKPGDIISSMAGKSIFIGNTDAEGRLTLVDAVHFIIEKEKVNKVIDIATLTGAALHCLGTEATPGITNNDELFDVVNDSFAQSGDLIWKMPVFDEFKEKIKHEQADLTNTAGQPGTITAGLFIGDFVGDLPWVHLDIAGTSWTEKVTDLTTKGGTGAGARALYHVAKQLSN